MVANDQAGYLRGYRDGERDARDGNKGTSLEGLPLKYRQGYAAGQRDGFAAVRANVSTAISRVFKRRGARNDAVSTDQEAGEGVPPRK